MNKKISKGLVFLFCASTYVGCATQTFVMRENPSVAPYKKVDEMQHFFIYGLGQEKKLKAAKICGGIENVYKVQTKYTFVNWLLAAVTIGIYTPHQAKVYCLPKTKSDTQTHTNSNNSPAQAPAPKNDVNDAQVQSGDDNLPETTSAQQT